MIIIAHRGNLNGPNPELENVPDQLRGCIKNDFSVEVDIWYQDSKWALGHDSPTYEVDTKFIFEITPRAWFHAKTIQTAKALLDLHCPHFFYHEEDPITLTSNGYLWTYPGKELTEASICVMPEINKEFPENCAGVCTDYAQRYRRGK